MNQRIDRRRFLQGSAYAGFGIFIAREGLYGQERSANERLRFGCIGVGGKGNSDTDHVGALGDVVALCDVDADRLGKKAEKFPAAKTFADFRALLEEFTNKIDAVTVSTPDHTHAAATVQALRLGKPVYCQKPLAHSCYEARLMREVAAEKKLATQMGNQGTSHPGFRKGIELIRSGKVGPIREVHVWTNRPFKYWKQAPDIVARPSDTTPPPKHLSWKLWLGPAPERPYHPVYHPHDWRGWWDFGTGAMGDMACHTANLAFMALKLGLPTKISAESAEVNQETYPAWATIRYEFPERDGRPAVKLTWYEGARDGKRHLPPSELFQGRTPSDSGSLLVGERGSIFSPSDYGSEQMILIEGEAPEPKAKAAGEPAAKKKANRKDGPNPDTLHKAEWVEAIRKNDPAHAWSNFGYAGVLTEAMLLGNVAVRTGKTIEFDPKTGLVTNLAAANRLVRPEFESGWGL
ncbi:MAG: Gfo/Idh/MocA family oxidoreductase [Isosphaeraceae bacterium]|nr:Gfo/Idh/MocA family oxidoreductase [Isosphaeraceae bacterium]